jgi:hypothetical protein
MYKKYDQCIKDIIIKTGNINAFPELNIPRTTALYWINNSKTKLNSKQSKKDIYQQEISKLRTIKNIEESKVKFLINICKIYSKKYSITKEKFEIIKVIDENKMYLGIITLCSLSGVNLRQYYKHKAVKQSHIYKQRRPNQLTIKEQQLLIKTSNDRKLGHLSIKQLQLHAFRNNIIHCHYDTWRKYIHNFNPNRILIKVKRNKTSQKSLNITKPNEVWHIDITYFKGINGSHIYLQVILDSYTRSVISWIVSDNKNSNMTLDNIKKATINSKPTFLFCDGGGENISLNVSDLLRSKNITRIVTSGKTKRLNARIEAFFNIIKNRYLNKHKSFTLSSLEDKFKIVVKLYNNSPSTHFNGATPSEMMKFNYNVDSLKHQLNEKIKYAKLKRINNYKKNEVSHP